MFFYQGLSCPHCTTPFTEQDDIVACPVCGAPHHRDCWKEGGGCACASKHGTDEQWSREQALNAVKSKPDAQEHTADSAPEVSTSGIGDASAQEQKPPVQSYAPFGAPPSAAFNEYAPFHANHPPCGGVSPDAVLDGETASDLSEVVAVNTTYYLPRFERMATRHSYLSWNWAAFIAPGCWLLYRKQYLTGAAVLLFRVLSDVFLNLLMLSVFSSALEQDTLANMYTEIERITQSMNHPELLVGGILAVWLALFCIHLLVALFGNRLYMKHCLHRIKKSREFYPEGYGARLPVIGGTSISLALVGFMCYQLLPSLIMMIVDSLANTFTNLTL